MKIFFLAALFAAACAPQQTENPLPNTAAVPLLDAALMQPYMKELPLVLKASEDFIKSPEGQASAKDQDNSAFYRFLYKNESLSKVLIKAGFTNAEIFGIHHEAVVAAFISINENPELPKDAKIQLPALQKELASLLLKQERDKNNASLNATSAHLQAQVNLYQNILTLTPYFEKLKLLNSQ